MEENEKTEFKNIVKGEFKDFVNSYREIVTQINEIDVEDRTSQIEELEEDIRQNEGKIQKGNVYRQVNVRTFEEYAKEFMENIKNDQEKIEELRRFNQEVLPDNIKKKEELQNKYKVNVRKNIEARKEALISELEGQKIEFKETEELANLNKEIAEIQKQIDERMDEYNAILKSEQENLYVDRDKKYIRYPARDEKYKQFLVDKVNEMKKDMEPKLLQKEELSRDIMSNVKEVNGKIDEKIKIIKEQYKECVKDFTRIDNGEKDSVLLEMESEQVAKPKKDVKKVEPKIVQERDGEKVGIPRPQEKPEDDKSILDEFELDYEQSPEKGEEPEIKTQHGGDENGLPKTKESNVKNAEENLIEALKRARANAENLNNSSSKPNFVIPQETGKNPTESPSQSTDFVLPEWIDIPKENHKDSTQNVDSETPHRLTDKEVEEVEPVFNEDGSDNKNTASFYLEPDEEEKVDDKEKINYEYAKMDMEFAKKQNMRNPLGVGGIRDFRTVQENIKRGFSISEITCMTKLGLYVIKYNNGVVDYFDPRKDGILSKDAEIAKSFNIQDDIEEAKNRGFIFKDEEGQMVINDGVDFNIVDILYDQYGFGRDYFEHLKDYFNGKQSFSVVYDDSMSYEDYEKMINEADEEMLDGKYERKEDKSFVDKILAVFTMKDTIEEKEEKEETKLDKLSFSERRYLKKLAGRSKEAGLKVISTVDNRSIFKKFKDLVTGNKRLALTAPDIERENLKRMEQDRIGYKRKMEDPEVIESLKKVKDADHFVKTRTDKSKEGILYHSGENGYIYNNAKDYYGGTSAHEGFVRDLVDRAGKEAVDKNMEETLKKINQDMGIDLPTTKNGARRDSQSDEER